MSLNSLGYRYGLPLASEEASIRPEFFVNVCPLAVAQSPYDLPYDKNDESEPVLKAIANLANEALVFGDYGWLWFW